MRRIDSMREAEQEVLKLKGMLSADRKPVEQQADSAGQPSSGGDGPPSSAQTDFSRPTSSDKPDGDKRTMAATVGEGTAPKPVKVNAGASVARPNSGNEIPRKNLTAVPVLAEPTHTADGSSAFQDGGEARESTPSSTNDDKLESQTTKAAPPNADSDSRGGSQKSIESLKEGIYEHIPPRVYLGLPEEAVSRSDLLMLDPPARYRYWRDHPQELKETPAMSFGTAFHTLILEPDVFHARHVVSKYSDFRTNEAKNWRDEQMANGVTVLTEDQMDALIQMEQNARENPIFHQVFRRPETKIEVSVLSKHTGTGILRKCRIDAVPPGNSLWDIKTIGTESGASPESAGKAIVNMEYGFQAAMSLDCWNAQASRRKDEFTLFFVESTPPYLCAAYVIPHEVVEGCRKMLNARLYLLAECRANRRWPSYKAVDFAELPFWYLKQMEQLSA